MGIFDERIEYKPFEYPIYFTKGWMLQMQAFWLHTEIPMQNDVKDFRENLTDAERNLVGNILLGFAQTETAVADYWTGMVTKWFPKHEIKQMAMAFGSQETIHAAAYSYLNETLGLDDFKAFLHEPATAARFENLVNTKAEYNHSTLKVSPQARQDVARSIAVFSALAEGVALYSSFAVLYSFQMRNLLKGIGQQMKWSVRDESLHSTMGITLFNQLCEEYPELRDAVRAEVEEASRLAVQMEVNFIDKMFEMGDLENLKAKDLKEFIKKRANEKLQELGYSAIFEYDKDSAGELDWFYHLTGGVTHTDFFAMRSTDYSKASEGEDFESIWD
jgi:ribonucleoside-diphosphate reductase beta chain